MATLRAPRRARARSLFLSIFPLSSASFRAPFSATFACACACSWVVPSVAHAQVNTEPFRKRIKETGYSFFLQGTFDGHTGNTYGLTADGLIGGGVSKGRSLAFALASVDYSKLNGTLGEDKSFAHVRYDYTIVKHVSWEAFVQEQSDVFQLIKTRDLVGTGPRFAIYDDPHFGLFLGIAYM